MMQRKPWSFERLADLHKRFKHLRPDSARLDLSGIATDVNGERWVLVGDDRWQQVKDKSNR